LPLFDLMTPISPADLQNLKVSFDNLQGNLLKSHGRDRARHIFLTFTGSATAAGQFLATMGARHVVSANQQIADTAEHKASRNNLIFEQVLLSAAGYRYLGLVTDGFDPFFQAGMQAAQTRIFDPPPSSWQSEFREPVHALVIVAHDDNDRVEDREDEIRDAVQTFARVHVETGEAIHNVNGNVIEHFGYVDGRSQPLFFQDDVNADPHITWNPSAGPNLIIVRDPLGKSDDDCGSYFVFRKLEQNVRGFKQHEQDLADALGLTGGDRERAGAMVVGRFEDGTPVALQNHDGLHSPVPNDFAYPVTDPAGSRCPFSSHIRKVNPRGDSVTPRVTMDGEKAHRIARRGITYGGSQGPSDNIADNPTGGVGLLFQCCNQSLQNQFEFIQGAWANDPNFVKPATGEDPIIGQSRGTFTPGQWPDPWGSTNRVTFAFHSFVTLLGGEYFFCPSITFLKSLAG
jgi:Dyp-type peroxidase family